MVFVILSVAFCVFIYFLSQYKNGNQNPTLLAQH